MIVKINNKIPYNIYMDDNTNTSEFLLTSSSSEDFIFLSSLMPKYLYGLRVEIPAFFINDTIIDRCIIKFLNPTGGKLIVIPLYYQECLLSHLTISINTHNRRIGNIFKVSSVVLYNQGEEKNDIECVSDPISYISGEETYILPDKIATITEISDTIWKCRNKIKIYTNTTARKKIHSQKHSRD